jgi:proteasome beta subunit
VAMPFFAPGDDPGANFPDLLKRIGLDQRFTGDGRDVGATLGVPHATTCVALRYDGGVVIAGDRRATSGNIISHRSMEKVVQADRHSAVAIAGSAGPAMEMVKMFQLQLEHYEKVEGSSLSLEGKANQLSSMVRSNLPAAMQGMVVVPIFAGYDLLRATGRLWDFDATGGRYEERDFVSTGSGSLHAGTVIKVGFRHDLNREQAIDLAATSLWEAADADSATGGPDVLRGIYPVIASIDSDGWERIEDADLARRYERIIQEVAER